MTEHEDPLEGIRRLVREERGSATSRAWEDVVTGRLDPEAAAARARAEGRASEGEIALAKRLFAPLSPEFEASLLERLSATSADAGYAGPVREISSAPARRRSRMVWGAGVAVAAAAAVALVLAQPSGEVTKPRAFGPALPSHALVLHGVADVRGSEASETALMRGRSTSFELRPSTRNDAPRMVAACLVQGKQVVPLAVTVDPGRVGDTLSVHAAVPAEVAAGAWEFVGVVSSRTAEPLDCPASGELDTLVVRSPITLR